MSEQLRDNKVHCSVNVQLAVNILKMKKLCA